MNEKSGDGRKQPKKRNSSSRSKDTTGSTIQTATPLHFSGDDPTLDELDSAGADSFPASDPPSMTSPTKSI
jgi:hypothetical protein